MTQVQPTRIARRLCVAVVAFALFWGTSTPDAVAQGSAASDRAALEALYDATGGARWTDSRNWKTSAPLGEWHGVTTDAAGRVAQLHLRRNGLAGSVPPELGSLMHLEELDLGENDLGGAIPDELGNLVNLKRLRLGWNDLTGALPVWLGNLAELEVLWFELNNLSGPIPGELGSLVNLEGLWLGWNALTGPLPRQLIQLRRLAVLDIQRTGACAPADTAFQEWLATIDFSGVTCNRPPQPLGAIPAQALTESGPAVGVSMEAWFSDPDDDPLTYEASSSRTATVTALASGDTIWLVPGAPGTATVTVTASDPDGLSATQTMTVTTAPSAGPQSDREVLEVLYDGTGGPGWTNRRNWTTSAPLDQWYGVTTNADGRVVGVELGENGLAGPIPASLGHLASLESLWLSGNDLTGPLPAELGSLASLTGLSLSGNDLTGRVPARLGNLVQLRWLDLEGNAFTGPIPGELASLVNLEGLFLGGNDLTGPVPARLGNLVRLGWLDLDGNAFSGPIPGELASLVNLEGLFLGGNDLTGPIPGELASLANLEALDLSYNWGLSGPLPPSLRLPRLKYLDIFLTQTCAPIAWLDRFVTIEFTGRLCETEPDVIIDVAVVYTPAARVATGGGAEIEAEIDLMIAETNQAYADSGVRHRLALVDVSEVSYTETGDSDQDLGRLADASDGHMDDVHALRDRVGADLVHLIVDEDKADVGGMAYIAGAFGLSVHNGGGLVFGHELGHNMGLLHDRYVDRGNLSSHPAYGYVNQRAFAAEAARSSRWRTIMSYFNQCEDAYVFDCSWLLRFSNPRQRYNGDPLGIPFGEGSGVTGPADAAAVLNATGPAVALWRDRPDGANRSPAPAGTLPDRLLTLPGTLDVDVSAAFVDPDGDALTYAVSSSAPSVVTVSAAGARVTLTAVSAGTSTIRVTAMDPGGLSAAQAFTVSVSTGAAGGFTDDPLRPGVTPVRAIHFTELRARIDALREAAGLGRFRWTDPALRAGATPVRLVHLTELRSALAAAYTAAGRSVPRWTDAAPVAGTTPIRAVHLTELRAAVVALE